MRETSDRRLARPTSVQEAQRYTTQPVTAAEVSLALIADWGPTEDWSDWIEAMERNSAKAHVGECGTLPAASDKSSS